MHYAPVSCIIDRHHIILKGLILHHSSACCCTTSWTTEMYGAQPTWVILLTLIGSISLAKSTFSLIRFLYVFFLRPTKDLKSRYGPWAVVTGATEGIGKALAFELARQGLHLVLVGRNPNKLQAASSALLQEYPTTKVKTVVFDLAADDTTDGLRRLREEIEGLDIGVLINNAGVSNRFAMMFDEVEIETWMNIIKVNVRSLTEVTRAVLPGMLERKRGAVVNIGSGSAVALPSFPLFAVYTGSKAYIDQFSKSLHGEYKYRGVDVQCQHPLYVATRMVSKVAKVKWYNPFVASPDVYARASMRWIGYEPRCFPYLPHFLQWVIIGFLPDFVCDHIFLRVNTSQKRVLKRG